MAHRKYFTTIVVSVLLVIPLFCEAVNKRDTETEDSSSGEAEIPRLHDRVGYGSSPEVEEGQDQDPSVSQEEGAEQSTTSPVAAVDKETNHLPRELDNENVQQEHGVEEESVESTTSPAALSSAEPLAPIPSEEQDVVRQDTSSHQSQAQQPTHEGSLNPRPSESVIIWDGTGEPEREHTAVGNEAASQPEQPSSQPDQPTSQPKQSGGQPEQPASKPEQPDGQPEQPVDQPEQPRNQPNQPLSQELHGGANGNGQRKDPATDPADKSRSSSDDRKQDGGDSRPVSDKSSGSTSSSMAWVVVFAVVSSALLISGMGDSEADRESSCHLGCRHNFADFNPYAWPPTPVNHNGITLRPVT